MRTIVYLLCTLLTFIVMMVSCNAEPSLQKYFVEKNDKQNFVTLDIGRGLIKNDSVSLSPEQDKSLETLEKINVLIYKGVGPEFEKEKATVKSLLSSGKYDELMKMGSKGQGASVNLLGQSENIEEFVVFAYKDSTGFGVIRVLGNGMTTNDVMNIVSVINQSGLNMKELKPLEDIMKK